jgi:CRP-like cAMP-binding protein
MQTRLPNVEELTFFFRHLEKHGVPRGDIEPHLRTAMVKKREILMAQGDEPELAGLVVSGVLSEYYLTPNGVERTRAFSLPGSPFGSLSDALAGRPSRVFIRAEAPSRVLLFTQSVISALAAKSAVWERLRMAIVLDLFLRKSTREYELLALDAAGRYQSLREQHPGLEARVSQTLIASYLGITPVHLSRVRARTRTSAQRRGARRKSESQTR